MTTRWRRKQLWVPAPMAALILASVLPSRGEPQAPDAVVAVVEGRKITYKEIRMPEESLKLEYRLIHGKFPESKAELRELSLLSTKSEKELLTSKIKSIIWRNQIAKLGIVVTSQEMAERQRALLEGVDLQAAVAEQREMAAPLIRALRSVLEKKMDEKLAYETYLSGRIPYEHWLVHKQYYNTPRRIAMLETLLKQTPEDLLKPDAGTRALVEGEKLDARIDAELSQTDPEFARYYAARLAKDTETMSKIHGGNPNYVLAKRAEWWRQRYAEANIQILNKKYDEVLRLLVNPVSPSPPSTTSKR